MNESDAKLLSWARTCLAAKMLQYLRTKASTSALVNGGVVDSEGMFRSPGLMLPISSELPRYGEAYGRVSSVCKSTLVTAPARLSNLRLKTERWVQCAPRGTNGYSASRVA